MNKLVTLLLLLTASTAHSESIGDVNYAIPQSPSAWKEDSRDKKDHYETVIYIPGSTTRAETKEFFGAIAADRPHGSMDQKDIEADLKKNFPDHNLTVKILETNPNDVTYEWTVNKGDFELSGITKGFRTDNGIVILSYQVFGPLKEESRDLFIPLLKQAQLQK